jgi:hypothetical protein
MVARLLAMVARLLAAPRLAAIALGVSGDRWAR